MSIGCWKRASIRRPSRASRSACALGRLGRWRSFSGTGDEGGAAGRSHGHHGLVPGALPGHPAGASIDHDRVGRDVAAHDRLAQSPGRVDGDGAVQTADGVDGEHHAGRLRVDHPLHDHRDRDVRGGDALPGPVDQRPRRPRRRPATTDGIHQGGGVPDVQEALLLAGERAGRQVLRGGRRADRDAAVAERRIPLADLVDHAGGQVAGLEAGGDDAGHPLGGGDVAVVEPSGQLGDHRPETVGGHEGGVRVGGQAETVRHVEAGLGEPDQGLALAAEHGHVATRLAERVDVAGVHGDGQGRTPHPSRPMDSP